MLPGFTSGGVGGGGAAGGFACARAAHAASARIRTGFGMATLCRRVPPAMNDLSWRWIVAMVAAPLPIGMLIATPLWRRGETSLGNVAGTVVIFGTAFA